MHPIIPISLYIHFPWCIRKCPYCDFNSHTLRQQELPEAAYIRALIRDMTQDLPRVAGRQVHSIFMGGGTPSLFSASAMEKLLDTLQEKLSFEKNLEITLEANPGTIDEVRLKDYRSIGINRLSIGVQSFHNAQLKKLGRIHNAAEATAAIHSAKKAGFQNINVDLMYGLPDQSVLNAVTDLENAFRAEPTHISWYQLTIEPNTFFHHHPPALPNDEKIWEMQFAGQTRLQQQGFEQYEISAYAKPGFICQHNENYWLFGDYLGIGAGAHGKITNPRTRGIIRTTKKRDPKSYLAITDNYLTESRAVSKDEASFEFMLNTLRLYRDIPLTLFSERTDLPISSIQSQLQIAQQKGLIEQEKDVIRVTELGHRFLNDLVEIFLVAHNEKSHVS